MSPMGWEGIFVSVWYIKGFKYVAKETSKSQEKKVFWWTLHVLHLFFYCIQLYLYTLLRDHSMKKLMVR
jgi:hypothetical protein